MPPHSVFKGEAALPLVLRHSDVRKDIRLVCSLICASKVPAALSHLAATATCLSRLELNFSTLPVPPNITSTSFADALPALTNLCSLKVALPEDQQSKQSIPSSSLQPKFSYRDFCVLPKPDHRPTTVSCTSSLTRLTELQLLGMTNVDDVQQCIPVQVVSLHLSYNLGSLPVGDLQLGHLTALTSLTIEPCGSLSFSTTVGTGYVVMAGDVLPDSIKSLNITDTDTAAALEDVTQLRQLTLSAPSLSAQELRQLSSHHSSLTSLSLNYSCRHGYQCCMIDGAAKAWSSLAGMLQRLVLDMGAQEAGGDEGTANKEEDDEEEDDDDDDDDDDHPISTTSSSSNHSSSGQKCGYKMPVATLDHLGSLTQLTALVLNNVSIKARQDQVAAAFTQLRKLHTLQVRSLQLESKDALGSYTLALSLLGLLNLRQLQLSSLDEGLVEVRPLSLLCQLTALDLSHTQGLDSAAVGCLSRLAGLRQLRLAGTCGVTDASVQCLVMLKQLTLLDVRGTALAPAGAKKLMSSLRGLCRLRLDKALAAAIQ
eukprot:gene11702-11847_t